MDRKKRTVGIIVGVCALVFLALALVYCWLAFMPTHFDKAEKAMVPARERIAVLMKPRVGADAVATTHTRKVEAPMGSLESKDAAGRETYGPVHRLCFYEEVMSYETARVKNQAIVDCAPFVDKLAQPIEDALGDHGMGSVEVDWETAPAPGAAILPLLTAAQKETLIHRTKEEIAGNDMRPVNYELSDRECELLHRYLDQLEAFLLRENWDLSAPVQPVKWRELGSYHVKALMAIARASLQGDQPRALKLIDRYFESVRLINMFYMQVPQVTTQDSFPSTVLIGLNLTELPELPDAAWDHVRAGLERFKLSRQQREDLRAVRSLAWHKEFARRVNDGQYEAKKNWWHSLGGGMLESALNTAMRPIAMRQVERLAMNQFKPEATAPRVNNKYRRPQMLALTLKMMNMSDVKNMQLDAWSMDRINRRFSNGWSPSWESLEQHRRINKGEVISLGRFPIAYVGRWERKFIDGEKRTRREDGIKRGSAVANYIQKIGHHPDTVEEIEALKKEAGAEEVSSHVKWYDAPEMLVMWSASGKYFYVGFISRNAAFVAGMKKYLK